MSSVVCGWQAELVQAFSELFLGASGVPGDFAPECGDGWHDLLRRLCVRIRTAVEADGGSFRITRIHERFGTLRVYWDGRLSSAARAEVDEAIKLAEARSSCTCEICGEAGRLYRGDWLTTRCEMHAQRREPVKDRRGFERVHLVSYVVDGEILVVCRRYDRERDAFIDFDLASLVPEGM